MGGLTNEQLNDALYRIKSLTETLKLFDNQILGGVVFKFHDETDKTIQKAKKGKPIVKPKTATQQQWHEKKIAPLILSSMQPLSRQEQIHKLSSFQHVPDRVFELIKKEEPLYEEIAKTKEEKEKQLQKVSEYKEVSKELQKVDDMANRLETMFNIYSEELAKAQAANDAAAINRINKIIKKAKKEIDKKEEKKEELTKKKDNIKKKIFLDKKTLAKLKKDQELMNDFQKSVDDAIRKVVEMKINMGQSVYQGRGIDMTLPLVSKGKKLKDNTRNIEFQLDKDRYDAVMSVLDKVIEVAQQSGGGERAVIMDKLKEYRKRIADMGDSDHGGLYAGLSAGKKTKKQRKKRTGGMSAKQMEWLTYVDKIANMEKYKDLSRGEVMKIASRKRKKQAKM